MAASIKGVSKIKAEFVVERAVYDEFVRHATRNGYAANILIERFMRDYMAGQQGKTYNPR
jgi:hypothetical protein